MDIHLIFEKIGFRTAAESSSATETIEFQYISNTDGSIRWIWPSYLRQPLFLKFYHPGTWKARLFVLLVRILFSFRLQKRFFKKTSFHFTLSPACIVPLNSFWALFTGTAGPNRKALLVASQDKLVSFIKIGLSEESQGLIQNEVNSLEFVAELAPRTFRYPVLKGVGSEAIELSEVPGRKGVGEFTNLHELALSELRDKTYSSTPLFTIQAWEHTRKNLEKLARTPDSRIPAGMIRKLLSCIETIDQERLLDVAMAHGDFTPWNTRVTRKFVSVFDWELSQREMPVGFDAFHFIIQNGILVERLPWKAIRVKLERLFRKNALMGDYSKGTQELYLNLYLIINTTYYLGIYLKQQQWHQQVSWLLNTWNDALNSMLQGNTHHRNLLAMDVVSFMNCHKYAVIKDKGERPEDIDVLSDIDFVTSRKSYAAIHSFIRSHSLVSRTVTYSRSNMASEKIFMRDGSILCLDFIWKIKRKGVQFMDTEKLINAAVINKHGVKIATQLFNARFVAYFYALNNSPVPISYRHYSEVLRGSDSPTDELLAQYVEKGQTGGDIAAVVNMRPENAGRPGFVNKVNFVLDSIRTMTRARGMVITFSGVDGAGKSTIIEQLKGRLEKSLRKRVVVLRHRPSVLPILSAWTKGKAKAESDAAERLPRQGKNGNRLSSFVRFLYYYIDYLFGQFYVLVRYVWRDYIVLYDRYYFDFISDGRRSNIDLPPAVTRAGYRLILKPRYNFFLYASPDMILSRKRELDRETITELTTNYLNLFKSLDRRSDKRYISIENREVGSTLGTIFEYIAKAS